MIEIGEMFFVRAGKIALIHIIYWFHHGIQDLFAICYQLHSSLSRSQLRILYNSNRNSPPATSGANTQRMNKTRS